MTPAAFEPDHHLVERASNGEQPNTEDSRDAGLIVPEGNEIKDFMLWVNQLPEREPPNYLGLPANAEKMLLVGHGRQTIDNLVKIRELLEESEQIHGNVEQAEE